MMDIVAVALVHLLIWGEGEETLISMKGSCIVLGGNRVGSLNVWRRMRVEAE